MPDIIGIDLGTTNSEVAVVRNGRPELLTDQGEVIIPSVVGLSPEDALLVGRPAANQRILYPERTIRSIKRRMGENVAVKMGEKSLTPPEVSALILGKLRDMAQAGLGTRVDQAVITVPAFFNERQRKAMHTAGELAGLKVARILNEPTAAALAYGMQEDDDRVVMVYDLGGGTFDVSIVEMVGGVYEVRASHGDTKLGGDDFDELIIRMLVEDFQKTHGGDPRLDLATLSRLTAAAERAKIELSTRPFAMISEAFLTAEQGRTAHYQYELSRQSFNDLIYPLIEKTGEAIDRALKDAGMKAGDIQQVLLVGGSTRIPLIWEYVADKMHGEPRCDLNPEEAVALGAAVQAAIIAGEDVNAVLVDVTSHSLGVEVVEDDGCELREDVYNVLIRRNSVIPTSRAEVYRTLHGLQTKVKIDVYQGEEPQASRNTHLGSFMLEDLPQGPEEGAEIVVQFDLDVNGLLNVSATHKTSKLNRAIKIHTNRSGMSKAQMEKSKSKLADLQGSLEGELKPLRRIYDKAVRNHKPAADHWIHELWLACERTAAEGDRDKFEQARRELLEEVEAL